VYDTLRLMDSDTIIDFIITEKARVIDIRNLYRSWC
jgi:hypothetical protein